ncbi:ABC transporter permease [Dorea formicigenerans]|uniref:ABC transporter permease n=1 Tax=Dorea formicigenerans TaxID=39486 RepID=UPI001D00FA66|nr:ABC transporter permease [Dorea formicigenerans]MCB5502933.1 ABC transporter permease [Dorea formicigenerans]
MGSAKRAVRCLIRKKSKTVILFLVLLISEAMILSTGIILKASNEAKSELQKKTKTKILAGIVENNNPITMEEINKIQELKGIDRINKNTTLPIYPSNFQAVTENQNTNTENLQVRLVGYDDLKLDGAFAESEVRLVKGKYPKEKNEVVVNQMLAEVNKLEIGDTLTVETDDGKKIEGVISGYYLSGLERKQSKEMAAVYRIENTIYAKTETIVKLQEVRGYESISVYLKKPEELDKIEKEIQNILGEKAELTKSDMLFRQMKQPLEQVMQVVKLMLYLTLGTSAIVITLLLCMWMRVRKKEIAVYISLGKSKCSILSQLLLESFLVFTISSVCSIAIGNILAEKLKDLLFAGKSISALAVKISPQLSDIGILIICGAVILFIGIGISVIPVLRTNPKDTLSEMEG